MKRLSLILAATFVTSFAFADQPAKNAEKKEEKKEARDEKHEEKKEAAADAGLKKGHDDDDDDDVTDGGKAGPRRTPAQLNWRKDVWQRREKEIDDRVHKHGKKLTDAEKDMIKKHWLTVSRLMRIRELAQDAKDDATVKRVDAALAKVEKGFDEKIEKAEGGAK
jgi:hypothetical protein